MKNCFKDWSQSIGLPILCHNVNNIGIQMYSSGASAQADNGISDHCTLIYGHICCSHLFTFKKPLQTGLSIPCMWAPKVGFLVVKVY